MTVEDIVINIAVEARTKVVSAVSEEIKQLGSVVLNTKRILSDLGKAIDAALKSNATTLQNQSRAFKEYQDRIASVLVQTAKPIVQELTGARDGSLRGVGEGLAERVFGNQKDLASFSKDFKERMEGAGHIVTDVGRNSKKTANSVGNLRGVLLGAALSAMFFGMALKNAATNVFKSGSRAFKEVMHSVEGTVTSFDLLEGSLKYLGFTVGQALEPLAAMLIPIIDGIADFVANNPKLVQSSVAFAAISGTILFIGGQIGTFIVGMSGLSAAIGTLGSTSVTANTNLLALKGTALAFSAITIAFILADALTDENGMTLTSKDIAKIIMAAAPAIFMFNPAAGIITASIGVLLFVLPETDFNLKQLWKSTSEGAQITWRNIYNAMVKAYNLLIDYAKLLNLATPGGAGLVANRLLPNKLKESSYLAPFEMDAMKSYGSSQMSPYNAPSNMSSGNTININMNVYDSEQVASKILRAAEDGLMSVWRP